MTFIDLLKEGELKIPMLQRDYAQGRMTDKVKAIREKFLTAVFTALKDNKPLALDFVYGSKSETTETFYPLDGQQRLTTLFLLHWYIAAREGHIDDTYRILKNFSYETRHSSRVFCELLVKYSPKSDIFDCDLKESIINEPWFMASWENDATISSMLVMLRAINCKYNEYQLSSVWESLVSTDNCPITFELLRMSDFGLSDQLYVKMNSRGKELTEFELWKGDFSEQLSGSVRDEFDKKIDNEWSNLIWNLYKDADGDISQAVDAGFLYFYEYAKDIIGDDKEKFIDWLDIITKMFKEDSGFFERHFYFGYNYQKNKVCLFFNSRKTNLFKSCTDGTATIGEELLLYACILCLEYYTDDFDHRLRQLRNLIENSSDNLRKDYKKRLFEATQSLITKGDLDALKQIEGPHFNLTQVAHELEKQQLIDADSYDTVCRLEDHRLLRGNISAFDISAKDFTTHATTFIDVFIPNCDYEQISRALATFGDYSRKVKSNSNKYCFGDSNDTSWQKILTDSGGNAKKPLSEFLRTIPDKSEEQIIAIYIESNPPKTWLYYYVKYPVLRETKSGNFQMDEKTYERTMLNGERLSGKHWDSFLRVIENNLSCATLANSTGYGNEPLIFNNIEVRNSNTHFILTTQNDAAQVLLSKAAEQNLITKNDEGYIFSIKQIDGIDSVDRVEEIVLFLNSL